MCVCARERVGSVRWGGSLDVCVFAQTRKAPDVEKASHCQGPLRHLVERRHVCEWSYVEEGVVCPGLIHTLCGASSVE